MREYTIVYAKSPEELSEIVNEKMNYGWEPLGGVACHSMGKFIQAMFK